MRRSGNVCDTLVFLLVAILLPAWLLGHLFLMFFPANSSGMASQVATSDRSGAVAAMAHHGSSDKSESEGSESEGMIDLLTEEPDTDTPAPGDPGQNSFLPKQEVNKFETTISDLRADNQKLTFKANELANVKSEQQREIDELKNQLQQIPNENGQGKIASMSTQLRDMQNDYARLDEKFKSVQNERSQLASEVSDLQSKNQQLAMAQRSAGSGENDTAALVAASKKMLTEANEEKNRLQNRVSDLTSGLESAQTNLAAQKQELANSNSQLEQLNAKYTQAIKRLGNANGALGNVKPTQTNRGETSRRSNVRRSDTENFREYVSSQGNRSRLAFIQWTDDEQVVVRSFSNKQLYKVPIERFSLDDQKYLKSLKPNINP